MDSSCNISGKVYIYLQVPCLVLCVHTSSLLQWAISLTDSRAPLLNGLLQGSRARPSQQRKLQITNLSASQNHSLFVLYNFHTYKIKLSVKCLYSNSASLSHLLVWHLQSCFVASSVLFPSHIFVAWYFGCKRIILFFNTKEVLFISLDLIVSFISKLYLKSSSYASKNLILIDIYFSKPIFSLILLFYYTCLCISI